MKNIIYPIFCLMCLGAATANAQNIIGHSNGTFERTDGVRVGTTEKQGEAIRLSKEKLQLLKGKKITGIRTVVGTRNVDNLTFFIAESLDGQPAYQQKADGASTSWKEFDLDTPYTIGDEEQLFVGFTLEASTSYRPLAFDRSTDTEGLSWALSDGTWIDVCGLGFGNANIQLIMEDLPQFTDLCLRDLSAEAYYKAENAYEYSGEVFNFGTSTINSFDVTFSVGDEEPVVHTFKDLNLQSNSSYVFSLPEYTSSTTGYLPISMAVSNINGADDADATDNASECRVYLYPADMEKNILVEGFTGQACPNCPDGHRVMEKVFTTFEHPVIEVFHHSGYQADSYTMEEDADYTWFYNSQSTYAPAVMVNRMHNPDLKYSSPMMNVGENDFRSSLYRAAAVQPYVSVGIQSTFNEATGQLEAAVGVYTHVKPESEINSLTIFIMQDSIEGYQSNGGSVYQHRFVFRGTLNGSWGEEIELNEGQWVTKKISYTLPDAIVSSYEGKEAIPTEAGKMYLVAMVSAASEDMNQCMVYNCNAVRFGDNTLTTVAVTDTEADTAAKVFANGGQIYVSGEYTSLDIYDMTGKVVLSATSGYSFTLPAGLYIARVNDGGKVSAHKIAVTE